MIKIATAEFYTALDSSAGQCASLYKRALFRINLLSYIFQ